MPSREHKTMHQNTGAQLIRTPNGCSQDTKCLFGPRIRWAWGTEGRVGGLNSSWEACKFF